MNDGTGLEDHPDSSQAAHGRRETPAEQSFSGLPTTVHISADHAGRWLAVSMAALAVLAAASAVVSYAAQYRMVDAAKQFAPVAAARSGHPRRRGADLRDLGDCAGAAWQAGDPRRAS